MLTHRDIDFARPTTEDEERYARRLAAVLESERARREARRLLDTEAGDRPELPRAIDTLRDWLARPRSPARWRIEDWMPEQSRVMLTAQYKAGKTTMIAGLVRALADGEPWLGRDRVRPVSGSIVVIDTEMGASQLAEWYRAQQIRRDDRVHVLSLRGRIASLDLLDPVRRREWARRLRDLDTSVLVLDCLRPVLDVLGLDEHTAAGRALVALDALLAEAEIPEAVVVHHMGHQGERSRGDSRLRDWPDVEWRLMRQDDDPASPRYIAAYGRDVDIPESQLVYDASCRRLTIAGGSRRDAKAAQALDAILDVVATSVPMSGRAVKQALVETEHARDTIDAALRLGLQTGALVVEHGPRRARLYRSVRVSGSVPRVSADTVSECPAASIEADTHGHTQLDRVSVSGGTDGRF